MKKRYSIRNNFAIAVVCLILGTFAAWQYRSVYDNAEKTKYNNLRMEDIQNQWMEEVKQNKGLSLKIEELQKENNRLKQSGNVDEQLEMDYERAKSIAGLVPVTGSGVIITIATEDDPVETQANLLSTINELRASNAEAISINKERIGAMTEIRNAGNYVFVNGKRVSSPFKVRAIGDANDLYSAFNMNGGIKTQLEYSCVVEIRKAKKVSIPAIRDDGNTLLTKYMIPDKEN